MLMVIDYDVLRYLILPIIGMMGALIMLLLFTVLVIHLLGGRIKFRPFRIEYTMPSKYVRRPNIWQVKRRSWLSKLWKKEDLPEEPDEMEIRKNALKRARLWIKLYIIQSVLMAIFMIGMWIYEIRSEWENIWSAMVKITQW